MCGISGVFRLDGTILEEDRAGCRLMTAAQTHRGPDAEGLFSNDSVVLGHRRLAVIDLSPASGQPMSSADEDVWIVHNGEIYNFRALKDELVGRGAVFRSSGDTEVLIHGYVHWGVEGLLARLRGMFAFALYDRRRRELVLARDRFGIKPLYYAAGRERVVFASEVRALLASGLVPNRRRQDALARFLQLGSLPFPLTTIEGVEPVPPGHYVIASVGVVKPYWSLASHLNRTNDGNDRVGRTRALLEESTKLHLASDVPLGVFLSGGIDSSAVALLASEARNGPLTTLSIVFDESRWSEARFARLMAEHVRSDHREVQVHKTDFFEHLPRIFAAMDQPTIDGVNTYFVAKAARESGLTVVLSGLGGDELFLGYDHFRRAAQLERMLPLFRAAPSWLRRTGLSAMARFTRLPKLEYLATPTAANLYLLFRGLFSPREIEGLIGAPPPPLESLAMVDGEDLVSSFARFEIQHYLHDQLLKDTDFMSMAHSIETRVPFLDHPLVEHCLGLPVEKKLRPGTPKPLLLDALGPRLPREIWDRPKMGFTFPFDEWIRSDPGELRARSRESGLFEKKAIDTTWDAFQDGRCHWSRVWALVVASQLFD